MHPDGEQLERIRELVEAHKLHPVIDRVFPLEQVAEAFAHVEAGHSKGKVVLSVRS
jgi:alcohol dehydrogenase